MMYDAWYLTPRVTDDVDASFISVWKKNSSVRRLDFVLKTKLCLNTRSRKKALSLVIVNILMLDWYNTGTSFVCLFDTFNNFWRAQFSFSTTIDQSDFNINPQIWSYVHYELCFNWERYPISADKYYIRIIMYLIKKSSNSWIRIKLRSHRPII